MQRRHGPWSRANRLIPWPAAASVDPLPPVRIPQPEQMAATLRESLQSSKPAVMGTHDRHICARGLGLIGRGGQVSWLGRVWDAVWSTGGEGDPARAVVLAASALAADGIPLLSLLGASGCHGDARAAASGTARLCQHVAQRQDASYRLKRALLGVSKSLEAAASDTSRSVREVRHRVGWLACLGLASLRFYSGQLRSPLSDPRRVAVAADLALRLRSVRDLEAPHLHMATWLSDLAAPSTAPTPAQDVAEEVPSLVRQCADLLGPELGPPRELALLLCALGRRRGLRAEPAQYLELIRGCAQVRVTRRDRADFVLAEPSAQAPRPATLTHEDLVSLVLELQPNQLGDAATQLHALLSPRKEAEAKS